MWGLAPPRSPPLDEGEVLAAGDRLDLRAEALLVDALEVELAGRPLLTVGAADEVGAVGEEHARELERLLRDLGALEPALGLDGLAEPDPAGVELGVERPQVARRRPHPLARHRAERLGLVAHLRTAAAQYEWRFNEAQNSGVYPFSINLADLRDELPTRAGASADTHHVDRSELETRRSMAGPRHLGYPSVMDTRRGHIENGVVILEAPTDAPDGTEVTVIIRGADEEVPASDEELRVIDAGLAAARKPERIDARSFLLELRRGG